MNYVLIGCGGTGGWLATCLAKTAGPGDLLTLVDGDKFERKNMERQLACRPGQNKAVALAGFLRTRADVNAVQEYLDPDTQLPDGPGLLFCGADNHRARLRCLQYVDSNEGWITVICGNGWSDAEAYVYLPEWNRNEHLDPREYYPELSEDTTGDPLSPPCTGEIVDSTPQLAIANMTAAGYGMWLSYYWTTVFPELTDQDARDTSVFHVMSSAGRITTKKVKQ